MSALLSVQDLSVDFIIDGIAVPALDLHTSSGGDNSVPVTSTDCCGFWPLVPLAVR